MINQSIYQYTKGGHAYCLLRSLLRPSEALRETVEAVLSNPVEPHPRRGNLAAGFFLNPPVLGLHLRLQEEIATEHDIAWVLACAERLAVALGGATPRGAVTFALATDTPGRLPEITHRILRSAACRGEQQQEQQQQQQHEQQQQQQGVRCAVATNDGIGTVGHVSSKATAGKTSVSQRIWLGEGRGRAGRKEGRKGGRKEGRKEGVAFSFLLFMVVFFLFLSADATRT